MSNQNDIYTFGELAESLENEMNKDNVETISRASAAQTPKQAKKFIKVEDLDLIFERKKYMKGGVDIAKAAIPQRSLEAFDTTELKASLTEQYLGIEQSIIYINDPDVGNFIYAQGKIYGDNSDTLDISVDEKFPDAAKHANPDFYPEGNSTNYKVCSRIDLDKYQRFTYKGRELKCVRGEYFTKGITGRKLQAIYLYVEDNALNVNTSNAMYVLNSLRVLFIYTRSNSSSNIFYFHHKFDRDISGIPEKYINSILHNRAIRISNYTQTRYKNENYRTHNRQKKLEDLNRHPINRAYNQLVPVLGKNAFIIPIDQKILFTDSILNSAESVLIQIPNSRGAFVSGSTVYISSSLYYLLHNGGYGAESRYDLSFYVVDAPTGRQYKDLTRIPISSFTKSGDYYITNIDSLSMQRPVIALNVKRLIRMISGDGLYTIHNVIKQYKPLKCLCKDNVMQRHYMLNRIFKIDHIPGCSVDVLRYKTTAHLFHDSQSDRYLNLELHDISDSYFSNKLNIAKRHIVRCASRYQDDVSPLSIILKLAKTNDYKLYVYSFSKYKRTDPYNFSKTGYRWRPFLTKLSYKRTYESISIRRGYLKPIYIGDCIGNSVISGYERHNNHTTPSNDPMRDALTCALLSMLISSCDNSTGTAYSRLGTWFKNRKYIDIAILPVGRSRGKNSTLKIRDSKQALLIRLHFNYPYDEIYELWRYVNKTGVSIDDLYDNIQQHCTVTVKGTVGKDALTLKTNLHSLI